MAVIKLDDVKTYLNISGVTHDDALRDFIAAAEAAITSRVGPLEPTEITATVTGSGALTLPVYPVLELTSVSVGGSSLPLSGITVDLTAGVLDNGGGFDSRSYTVTYSAGRATCPADLVLAVKELVRHLWQTQRGPTARPGTRDSDATSNTVPGAAFIFPFRVEQLLAPHTQLGFA